MLKNLMKDKHSLLLVVLLVIFIVVDVKIPEAVSNIVDTTVGKAVVVLASLSLFGVNVLAGVFGIVAGYLLIQRSSKQENEKLYMPGETNKTKYLSSVNSFPVTVEEEVIASMLPMASPDISEPEYKPTLNKLHNATKL